MTDYIKREEALKRRHGCDSDCKTCDFFTDGDSWCEGEVFVLDLLSIPAADVVEQKHGNGLYRGDRGGPNCLYICSVCNNEIRTYQPEAWNYCPNCGARMVNNDV